MRNEKFYNITNKKLLHKQKWLKYNIEAVFKKKSNKLPWKYNCTFRMEGVEWFADLSLPDITCRYV